MAPKPVTKNPASYLLHGRFFVVVQTNPRRLKPSSSQPADRSAMTKMAVFFCPGGGDTRTNLPPTNYRLQGCQYAGGIPPSVGVA